MNKIHSKSFTILAIFGICLVVSVVTARAQITTTTWQGGVGATWDTTTSANWSSGIPVSGASGIEASFTSGTATSTIAIANTGVSSAGLNFGVTGSNYNYVFSGGTLTLDNGYTGGINAGSHLITLSGSNSNNYASVTFNNMVAVSDSAAGGAAQAYDVGAGNYSTVAYNGGFTLGNYISLHSTSTYTDQTLTFGGEFINNNTTASQSVSAPEIQISGTTTNETINWEATSYIAPSNTNNTTLYIRNNNTTSVTNLYTDPGAAVTFGGGSGVGGAIDLTTNGMTVNSVMAGGSSSSASLSQTLEVAPTSGSAPLAATWAGSFALPSGNGAGSSFVFYTPNANDVLTISSGISGGGSAYAVQKTGSGTLVFGALDSYTAASTTVSAGTLVAQVGGGYALGGSSASVGVSSGAALDYAATGTTTLQIASLAVTGGSGTTLGGSIGSTATNSEISVTGAATVSNAGALKVNAYGISGQAPATGTYTLIAGGSGSSLNGATSTTLGNVYNASNFTVGTLTAGVSSITLGITSHSQNATEYWVGGYSGGSEVLSISNGSTYSNWSTSASGTSGSSGVGATSLTPGTNTTMEFTGLGDATSATLGDNMSVAGIVVTDPNGVTLNGDGFALTTGTGGIAVGVNAGQVVLGSNINDNASQIWTNNSSYSLNVLGQTLLHAGAALTLSGVGGVTFNGEFTGNGSLINNSGAGEVDLDGPVIITGSNSYTFTNNSSNPIVISGAQVEMNTTGTVTFNGSGNTSISSPITGSGALVKSGAGTLTVSAGSPYSGATTVAGGTLSLTSTGSLGLGTTVTTVTVGGQSGGSATATLSGTGTVYGPLITSSANSNVGRIAPGTGTTVGTLTVGGAVTIGAGTALDVALNTATTAGGTSNGLITMSGTSANGTLTIGSTLTFNIDALTTLTTSSNSGLTNYYTIINGATGLAGTALSSVTSTFNITGNSTTDIGHIITSGNGNNLEIYFTSAVTGTTYTLTTGASSTLLHAGGSTTLTTTLSNTGGSSADSITYSGVGASVSGVGTISPTTTISGTLANNNTAVSNTSETLTTTAGASGTATISSTGTLTNTTVGGTPTGTPTGAAVTVYSGYGTWNTNGSGTWGATPTATPANWTASGGVPGVTAGFTGVDTATFGAQSASTITVGLNGAAPNLNSITFSSPGTVYTLAQKYSGGTGTSSITLSGTTPSINVTNPTNVATAGMQTISAPLVLGATTSLGVASNQTLNISGAISSSGSYGLSNTGSGTTILSSANTYSGPTTISAGKFYVNGGVSGTSSGTGSGAVTVNSGGTLAGKGSITSSGVTINGGGTLASGDTQSSTSGVVDGTHLTLNNTPVTVGSSVGTVNLTFDLGAGNDAGAEYHTFSNPNTNTTYLSLSGSTVINFAGTTSISLVDLTNLDGTGAGTLTLRQGTPYLLIQAGSNTDYLNLVINLGTAANPNYILSQDATNSQNGFVAGVYNGDMSDPSSSQITGNINTITIAQYGSDGVTPLSVGAGGIYVAPVLYLDAGSLEVVPEPGTWALMLGGLALLIVIQRRRRNT